MANWESNVYLYDIFRDYDEDKISVSEAGLRAAERLEKNESLVDNLEIEIQSLKVVTEAEEFDEIMNDITDYADDNLIWINTAFEDKEVNKEN